MFTVTVELKFWKDFKKCISKCKMETEIYVL